ncbi:MAG: hypothetical protein WCP97_07705 [bacterium]
MKLNSVATIVSIFLLLGAILLIIINFGMLYRILQIPFVSFFAINFIVLLFILLGWNLYTLAFHFEGWKSALRTIVYGCVLLMCILLFLKQWYPEYKPAMKGKTGYQWYWVTPPRNEAEKKQKQMHKESACNYSLEGWGENNSLIYSDSCNGKHFLYTPQVSVAPDEIELLPSNISKGSCSGNYRDYIERWPENSAESPLPKFNTFPTQFAFSPDCSWVSVVTEYFYGPRDIIMVATTAKN